uniref:G-protein coupled receptors family 1 profile domain-containing protein n=1 Tax=Xenopus tropicalis TaxID=8364 RepID=A0A1B8Y4N0_XENTR
MTSDNETCFHPTTFILLGIPGLEPFHTWISIPFCSIFLIAVIGNLVVLQIIISEVSLHQPMYIFVTVLSIIDLVLANSTMPKLLSIFWSSSNEIPYHTCLFQMFLLHAFSAIESGIFVAMAFDRYVAICNPLRSNIILHSYYVSLNDHIGMVVGFLVLAMDSLFIVLSYIKILRVLQRLPSTAGLKAFGTCVSHVCAILTFYVPILVSSLVHRFGRNVPHPTHILLANFYLLIPPMLNPLVYGMKTKKIQQKVRKYLYLF